MHLLFYPLFFMISFKHEVMYDYNLYVYYQFLMDYFVKNFDFFIVGIFLNALIFNFEQMYVLLVVNLFQFFIYHDIFIFIFNLIINLIFDTVNVFSFIMITHIKLAIIIKVLKNLIFLLFYDCFY